MYNFSSCLHPKSTRNISKIICDFPRRSNADASMWRWRGKFVVKSQRLRVIFFLFVTGISGKSQILFAIVYTTRYLDLLTTYISAYNSIMKIVFLAASYATLFLMYIKFKATYDHNHDTFRWEIADENGIFFFRSKNTNHKAARNLSAFGLWGQIEQLFRIMQPSFSIVNVSFRYVENL